MTIQHVVVFGAGGHAKVVIDCISLEGCYQVSFLADADPKKMGSSIHGCEVIDESQGLLVAREQMGGIVAIGNNAARTRVALLLEDAGVRLLSSVHPSAVVSSSVILGEGTVVLPGGVVNADTVLGAGVIINTRASVDHDCLVGDYVHVAPGATICGGARIGSGVLVGAGSVVLPGVCIGDGATIAAGAIVTSDVPAHHTYAGNPARKLERRNG